MAIATLVSFLGFFILFGDSEETKQVQVKQETKVEAVLSSSNYKRLR